MFLSTERKTDSRDRVHGCFDVAERERERERERARVRKRPRSRITVGALQTAPHRRRVPNLNLATFAVTRWTRPRLPRSLRRTRA